MKMDYACKYCQRPGSVNVGDGDVELEAARRWFPLLCCDRCGQFRVKMRNVRARLMKVATTISSARPETRNEILAKSDPVIELITKKIATLVCDYYRVTNVWERDFVDQITENPGKADLVVASYVAGVARIARA